MSAHWSPTFPRRRQPCQKHVLYLNFISTISTIDLIAIVRFTETCKDSAELLEDRTPAVALKAFDLARSDKEMHGNKQTKYHQ